MDMEGAAAAVQVPADHFIRGVAFSVGRLDGDPGMQRESASAWDAGSGARPDTRRLASDQSPSMLTLPLATKLNGPSSKRTNKIKMLRQCFMSVSIPLRWRARAHAPQPQHLFPILVWQRCGGAPNPAASRALSEQMEPFDRDDFASWLGAHRTAMQGIDEDVQRRHDAKAPGLRWGSSCEACIPTTAPRVRCGGRANARFA